MLLEHPTSRGKGERCYLKISPPLHSDILGNLSLKINSLVRDDKKKGWFEALLGHSRRFLGKTVHPHYLLL